MCFLREKFTWENPMTQNIAFTVLKVIVLFFFCIGLYRSWIWFQYQAAKSKVEKFESKRQYDPVLYYYPEYGEPLVLVNPDYSSTLFFLEGFRTQCPAGMYYDWFNELHNKYHVNVIVPVYGLQSSPFFLRNRDWHVQEDLRLVLQVYNSYTAMLPESHRIVTASMSFGAVPQMAILAKATRRPDQSFFMSPLNSGLDYKVSGPLIHWLSQQMGWIQYITAFSWAAPSPDRASVWDIKNKERNLAMASKIDANPEENSRYGYLNVVTAKWMEEKLIPRVKNHHILVAWGDGDLYFSPKGFTNFAELLKESGNSVETLTLTNSGHMLLLDNSDKLMKKRILDALLK